VGAAREVLSDDDVLKEVLVMLTFDPFRELNSLVGQTFGSSANPVSRWMPMDLYRLDDHFVVTVDLPGIDPGSIDLTVDGNTLTIRAGRTAPAPEGAQWLAQERPFGTYLRQVSLGDGLNVQDIHATYDAGVLSVTIPVAEQAKPRKIAIGSGGQTAEVTPQEQQPQLTT
jgi:HSP20 family protein